VFCYYKQELVKQTAGRAGMHNAWLDIITASRGSFTIPRINFLSRARRSRQGCKVEKRGPEIGGEDARYPEEARQVAPSRAPSARAILSFGSPPHLLRIPLHPSDTLHSRMNYHRGMVLLSLRNPRVPISSVLRVYLAITGLSSKSRGERTKC